MDKKLIEMAEREEVRGKAKWGNTDTDPIVLLAAATEELGEVAHACFHDEGADRVTQEIAEVMGILSRLHDMVRGK